MIWVVITLIFSIVLEANYISIPLTFASLVFWAVVLQRSDIFAMAFFAGLVLDALIFNSLGLTSAYFLLAIFAIFLYRSKFEIRTLGFVGVFCLVGGFIYMFLKGSENILFGSILLCVIEILCFKIYQIYSLKK